MSGSCVCCRTLYIERGWGHSLGADLVRTAEGHFCVQPSDFSNPTEWFKAAVLKTAVPETVPWFESHLLRHIDIHRMPSKPSVAAEADPACARVDGCERRRTSSRMRIPASMTAGPIPSPGTTAMFLDVDMARAGSQARRKQFVRPIGLYWAASARPHDTRPGPAQIE